MRVLTFRLPWAVLAVTGRKHIESRRGPVLNRYTGRFAIHVSKKSPGWELELLRLGELFDLTAADVASPYNPLRTMESLSGHIIGTVTAGPTVRDTPLYRADDTVRDGAVFDDLADRWLTTLWRPRWLHAPVPASGRLGLWSTDLLPDSLNQDTA